MSGAEKRWRQGEAWVGRDRVVWEGEEQVGIFLTAEIAASVVADHNARLDAEPAVWQWRALVAGMWSGWRSCIDQPKCLGRSDVEYRPLYTHPPAATAELATLRADLATVTAERDEAQECNSVFLMRISEFAERATAAEAGLATAVRDAWIAGRDAAAETAELGYSLRGIPTAIRALTPPAEAEGGRQDG